jgi:hypothetical protein
LAWRTQFLFFSERNDDKAKILAPEEAAGSDLEARQAWEYPKFCLKPGGGAWPCPYPDVLDDPLPSAASNSLSKSPLLGTGAVLAATFDLPLLAILAMGIAMQIGWAHASPVVERENDTVYWLQGEAPSQTIKKRMFCINEKGELGVHPTCGPGPAVHATASTLSLPNIAILGTGAMFAALGMPVLALLSLGLISQFGCANALPLIIDREAKPAPFLLEREKSKFETEQRDVEKRKTCFDPVTWKELPLSACKSVWRVLDFLSLWWLALDLQRVLGWRMQHR